MISYLFDASSIVNLVKRGLVRPLANGVTIDLVLYEALNAIWKEYKLIGGIDGDTALEYVDIISGVFEAVEALSLRGSEREVFELAAREGLTVYDASYLYAAMKDGLTLVTDDQNLKDKASKYVSAITTKDLTSK
jgi:predicted nucleic acid-binding protein